MDFLHPHHKLGDCQGFDHSHGAKFTISFLNQGFHIDRIQFSEILAQVGPQDFRGGIRIGMRPPLRLGNNGVDQAKGKRIGNLISAELTALQLTQALLTYRLK
jgi:hypothetical protein